MPFLGETAALTAAFFWGFGAFLFENAGNRIGALATNLLRLFFACCLLSFTLFLQQGHFFPLGADHEQMLWLGASGIVGLAMGDAALFYAIVILGPRLAILLLSLAPVITTLIAWIFLGERLTWPALSGITITLCAIIWVVSEPHGKSPIRGSKTVGVILGIIAAIGQGVGVILAKRGLTGNIDALSATLLRMLPATAVMWLIAIIVGQAAPTLRSLKNKHAAIAVTIGSLIGPYIGVWLSIVAVKHTEAGVASTLLATVPILIIPLEFLIHKRKPTPRALMGTILAVVGIALLFLRH